MNLWASCTSQGVLVPCVAGRQPGAVSADSAWGQNSGQCLLCYAGGCISFLFLGIVCDIRRVVLQYICLFERGWGSFNYINDNIKMGLTFMIVLAAYLTFRHPAKQFETFNCCNQYVVRAKYRCTLWHSNPTAALVKNVFFLVVIMYDKIFWSLLSPDIGRAARESRFCCKNKKKCEHFLCSCCHARRTPMTHLSDVS